MSLDGSGFDVSVHEAGQPFGVHLDVDACSDAAAKWISSGPLACKDGLATGGAGQVASGGV